MNNPESTEIAIKEKAPEERMSNYLFKMAKILADTEVVPANLRRRPQAIFAVINAGQSLGLDPTTSLQSFISIDGKLTMSAELMRSLIFREGHSISFDEMSSEQVILTGKRSTGETCKVIWTMDDAKRAGLAGKGSWNKYPRALLLARATTELARTLFPDVISGVSYTAEELGGEAFSEDIEIDNSLEVAEAGLIVEDAGRYGEPDSDQLHGATLHYPEYVPAAQLIEVSEEQILSEESEEEILSEIEAAHEAALDAAIASDRQPTPIVHIEEVEAPILNGETKPKLEGDVTQPQIRKIMAMQTKWIASNPELIPIAEKAYETLFGKRSKKDLTKQQAADFIDYLTSLEQGTK